MNDDNRDRRYKGQESGYRPKPSRKHININFSRGLTSSELIAILQLELLRARNQTPEASEATLPTEIIHDIKFRLQYYSDECGEISNSTRSSYLEKIRSDDYDNDRDD